MSLKYEPALGSDRMQLAYYLLPLRQPVCQLLEERSETRAGRTPASETPVLDRHGET